MRLILLIEAFLDGFFTRLGIEYHQWHLDKTFDRMLATPPDAEYADTIPGALPRRIWHRWL